MHDLQVPFVLFIFVSSIFLSSCDDAPEPSPSLDGFELTLPDEVAHYSDFEIPEDVINHPSAFEFVSVNEVESELELSHFFGTKNIPKITDAGATLGRVLFYDRSLSLNNSVSCGSCHSQAHAFADNKAKSIGLKGRETNRNSMAFLNPALTENMFWDSREPGVKDLVLSPVQDHIEMGMVSLDYLEEKLATRPYYAALFEEAYGSEEITRERISDAVAQFICSMTTFRSKFDQIGNGATLTQQEAVGKRIFFGDDAKCSSCHSGPNLAAEDFPGGEYGGASGGEGTTNIGLDRSTTDLGNGDGRFRIPSLRNIAVTGPYMHDGRFERLMDVVNHYDAGVKAHPALDDKLIDHKTGAPRRLGLSQYEKEALVAFLQTFTDEAFLTDEKFSDPFTSR